MFKWLEDLDFLTKGNAQGPLGLEFRIVDSAEARKAEGFGNVRDKLKMYREAKNQTAAKREPGDTAKKSDSKCSIS